ncbi:hypothetical protein CHELA1G2_12070 [Hyphomicrobiales bacterium]|nr:hypothetical protein CHELA1G2_12070 [Hyphomicrobiales bacterium]
MMTPAGKMSQTGIQSKGAARAGCKAADGSRFMNCSQIGIKLVFYRDTEATRGRLACPLGWDSGAGR